MKLRIAIALSVFAASAFGMGLFKKPKPEPAPVTNAPPAVVVQVTNTSGPVTNTSGPRLISVEHTDREFYIRFTYDGIDGWKEEFHKEKGKYLKGWIVVNGVEVEKFWRGMTVQHLRNAYGTDEHGVRIAHDQRTFIRLRSLDRKYQTHEVQFFWPWKGTRE